MTQAVDCFRDAAADDLFPTFKKSTIRRVLIDVESLHVLDFEK